VPIGPFAQAPIPRPDEVRRFFPRLKCGGRGACRIAAISATTGIDAHSDEAAQSDRDDVARGGMPSLSGLRGMEGGRSSNISIPADLSTGKIMRCGGAE
jgi:hypothetical protein